MDIDKLREHFHHFINLEMVIEILKNSIESSIKIKYNEDKSITLELQVEKKTGHCGYRQNYK